jgi:hypothetical protein
MSMDKENFEPLEDASFLIPEEKMTPVAKRSRLSKGNSRRSLGMRVSFATANEVRLYETRPAEWDSPANKTTVFQYGQDMEFTEVLPSIKPTESADESVSADMDFTEVLPARTTQQQQPTASSEFSEDVTVRFGAGSDDMDMTAAFPANATVQQNESVTIEASEPTHVFAKPGLLQSILGSAILNENHVVAEVPKPATVASIPAPVQSDDEVTVRFTKDDEDDMTLEMPKGFTPQRPSCMTVDVPSMLQQALFSVAPSTASNSSTKKSAKPHKSVQSTVSATTYAATVKWAVDYLSEQANLADEQVTALYADFASRGLDLSTLKVSPEVESVVRDNIRLWTLDSKCAYYAFASKVFQTVAEELRNKDVQVADEISQCEQLLRDMLDSQNAMDVEIADLEADMQRLKEEPLQATKPAASLNVAPKVQPTRKADVVSQEEEKPRSMEFSCLHVEKMTASELVVCTKGSAQLRVAFHFTVGTVEVSGVIGKEYVQTWLASQYPVIRNAKEVSRLWGELECVLGRIEDVAADVKERKGWWEGETAFIELGERRQRRYVRASLADCVERGLSLA